MVNCMVVKNAIKKTLKEGRFKLASRGIAKMIINTDHFQNVAINMISASSYNLYPRNDKGK